jgi:hypothetical protein
LRQTEVLPGLTKLLARLDVPVLALVGKLEKFLKRTRPRRTPLRDDT